MDINTLIYTEEKVVWQLKKKKNVYLEKKRKRCSFMEKKKKAFS